ncbi:MAG: rod shape-determining protein MreC [Candidatus Omnitrophica bacterium]|nr:rod shape-determining protein MreC [Candidatus Omnitrophota bacterium]
MFIFMSQGLIRPQADMSLLNDLKIENMILSLKVEELDSLAQENEKLRKALELKEENNIVVIYGRIWGFSPTAWRKIAFCSAGKRQNTRKESLVITEDKLLIGKVSEVFENYSTILLINDPYFSLPVFIEKKGMGLLQGTLSGHPKVLYIEAGQNVSPGDALFTSSQYVPFQIKVGSVSTVAEDPDDFFLRVEATPDAHISSTRDVFIIQ